MTATVETPTPLVAMVDEAPAAASQLVARTVPLPEDIDLNLLAFGSSTDAVLWHRQAFALAGRGVALRLVLPSGLDDPAASASVLDTLRAIPSDDEVGRPGCGPVVISALPFDRTAAAILTIPAMTVGREASGRRWLTTVGPPSARIEPGNLLRQYRSNTDAIAPDAFSLRSCRPHDEWEALVAGTVGAVRAGQFDKVVLAREIHVSANRNFVLADILRRLYALYPSCMVFSTGTFIGASPELLVSRLGSKVRSHPLAGTVARSGDAAADAALTGYLLASAKERAEHRFVVDEVANTLRPLCRALDVPDIPSIVALRNVSHLGTLIKGELRDVDVTVLDLVSRLHPTPAVAGTPTAAAVAYLADVEGFDRGCYSGPVGWMDSRGDGEWAVAVRSAEVRGDTARLFAGVGVVTNSDPASELAETQLKFQALLAAIVQP